MHYELFFLISSPRLAAAFFAPGSPKSKYAGTTLLERWEVRGVDTLVLTDLALADGIYARLGGW